MPNGFENHREPTNWELHRSIAELKDRMLADVAILRERVKTLEDQDQANVTYRRTMTVAVIAALLGALLSFVTTIILHFAFA